MSVSSMILAKYGKPGLEYQVKYCELWEIQKDFPEIPVVHLMINKELKAKLFVAFTSLRAAGILREIRTMGCLQERQVRGIDDISLHSWAMAVDINQATEKLGQKVSNFSHQFISIMKAAGIFWGGEFIHRPDPMHFALYDG